MTRHTTGTREQWLVARGLELLEAEEELTRRSDDLARRQPRVPRLTPRSLAAGDTLLSSTPSTLSACPDRLIDVVPAARMLKERPKLVDKDSSRLQRSETMIGLDETITAYTEIINVEPRT